MNTDLLQVGKAYKTRAGKEAVVQSETDDPVYPFFGKVFDKDGKCDRIAYWTVGGRYSISHQTEFDIS